MRRDPRGYLWDVREAADAIAGFIRDIDSATYAASTLIHSAIERKFEIIGEALNLLSKSAPALARRIPELERIVAFRNLLIHGYAVVNHARVWDIAQELLAGTSRGSSGAAGGTRQMRSRCHSAAPASTIRCSTAPTP